VTATAAPPAPPRRRLRLGRLLGVAVLALVAVVAASAARVVWAAQSDHRDPTEAIVVLGASQYDGTPSQVFAARLDHAAALHGAGVAPLVVTVGGNQPGDRFTEAQAGADYLAEAGVPRTSLLAVPTGSDTLTSVEAVATALQERGLSRVTIVSDPEHVLRASDMARWVGLQPSASPARGDAGLQPRYVIRETAGWWAFTWYRLTGEPAPLSGSAAAAVL
jgi:vancomycin permeability regulator SanA